jgi:hypothetical protein
MNLVDETKLQTAGENVADRAAKDFGDTAAQVLNGLDGWTLTIHIPPIGPLKIPDITVRLNKPKGETK